MTEASPEAVAPEPPSYRPEEQMTDLTELRLEVAKWRVIAFWGIPYEHHHHVNGDTAQGIEDKAHILADLLNLFPTEKQESL
ncbi:hypothetical protein [Pseudarthrobacter sp. BIM B-2242]|uniref:hypothetical protein n=1 Tax=Pseudarthrobacter sp. BIM B-2242 TaxID=2772401 RepID=UPI00168BFC59|nr:hypothetical protein [Pseudarthrobacter sp. BIM B-2242]QOD04877.1 hypothetical protein IDT60_07645 [Pseudarthrobacter sp. BIM B-2242]